MRQMFYYVSIIVLTLLSPMDYEVTERSITGPFSTKEHCLKYEEAIKYLVAQGGSKVQLSECKDTGLPL